jgi:hypothetical protein
MQIHNKEESKRFLEHIKDERNINMIFSGIFGIGKTYFLKEFFKANEETFEVFTLTPVNYSISNNEDVLNYIKYDLIFELLGKDIEFAKTDIPKKLSAQFYLNDNFLDTLSLLAKNAGPVGKTVSGFYDSYAQLVNAVQEHNEKVTIDDKKELIEYLKEINDKSGSIFEENRIIELIRTIIENINEKGKKTVLLIDDLDRLDPEHIFRILNVFACHLDIDNQESNKFGIQKIILVCDIENIRKIFSNKYGQDVDFSGYIDKFFSTEIYFLDNKEYISRSIDQFLRAVKIDQHTESYLSLQSGNKLVAGLLTLILQDLITSEQLNLRSLLKRFDSSFKLTYFRFKMGNSSSAMSSQFEVLVIFQFLEWVFGSISALQNALVKMANSFPAKLGQHYRVYGPIISYLDFANHQGNKIGYVFEYLKYDLRVHYNLTKDFSHDIYQATITKCTDVNGEESAKINFPFAELLLKSFELYARTHKSKD